MTREFTFGNQLSMSDGHATVASVEAVLMELIPGACSVSRAATVNDKDGTDWWVEVSGRHLSVDAKVRSEDWAASHPSEDDLALETYSVKGYRLPDGTRSGKPSVVGWTRDPGKRSDYILWLWQDTGRYCLIAFPHLCGVFQAKWREWSQQHKTREQFTKSVTPDRDGWYSECVFVPRREIWAEIYKRYAPNPVVA